MAHPPRSRLPVALATAAATATLAGATPALASEPGTQPGALNPAALQVPNFAPLPSAGKQVRPRIRRARVVPRRLRHGKRARLRLTLSTPGRVRILIERRKRGKLSRKRTITVDARKAKVSIKLPRGVHGHAFAIGRYRITVVVIDAAGTRSRPLRRTLRVVKAR